MRKIEKVRNLILELTPRNDGWNIAGAKKELEKIRKHTWSKEIKALIDNALRNGK